MATAPSPNDLTRQQLDELDALLQRMLSVPLAPADTPMPAGIPPARNGDSAGGPPLPPSWRVDPPAPAAGASLPHIALPEPPPAVAPKLEAQQAPLPPAPASPPPLPVPAPKPVAVAPAPVPKPPAPAPAPKAAPPVVPPPVPRVAAPITPVPTFAATGTASPPASTSAPVALPLLPLVAFNALFDSICSVFGPLGRLLRSGLFKHIYGFGGLALIAYTAAHIAQKANWLTLPIPLPWPR
jgi:hypothetical protein